MHDRSLEHRANLRLIEGNDDGPADVPDMSTPR